MTGTFKLTFRKRITKFENHYGENNQGPESGADSSVSATEEAS
jgi:hypothetical protein